MNNERNQILDQPANNKTLGTLSIPPPEEAGYLRLYFAIFGIELSEIIDIPEAAA